MSCRHCYGLYGWEDKNPSYPLVCTKRIGYAEVMQVEFDPKEVSYKKLLEVFWSVHDPTTKNRQGFDSGSQYRSVIFYYNEKQKEEASASRKKLEKSKKFKRKIVTEIVPASEFYRAEEYHQGYLEKKGSASC